MDLRPQVARRLDDTMRMQRRTNESVAMDAGYCRQHVSRVRVGQVREPSIAFVRAVAEVLGVEPSWLAGWTDSWKVGAMPNICDATMNARFVKMLTHCEQLPPFVTSAWEKQFVSDMRSSFDERETQSDLGMTMWNPSVKQWNELSNLYERER